MGESSAGVQVEVEDGGTDDGGTDAVVATDRFVDPSGQADEGELIEFIVDDLEREDQRDRAEEQALEEDEENNNCSDDDDLPDASMPDDWNKHDSTLR